MKFKFRKKLCKPFSIRGLDLQVFKLHRDRHIQHKCYQVFTEPGLVSKGFQVFADLSRDIVGFFQEIIQGFVFRDQLFCGFFSYPGHSGHIVG